MSWPLSRFWTWTLLILLGLFGLSTLATSLSQPTQDQKEWVSHPSVFNSKPSGYRAWHLTMQEAAKRHGMVDIKIWKQPFSALKSPKLAPLASTMVLIEPLSMSGYQPMMLPEDVSALLRWVKRGNTLVVLDTFDRKRMRALLYPVGLQDVRLKKMGMQKRITPTPDYRFLNTFLKQPGRTAARTGLQIIPDKEAELPQLPVLQVGQQTVLWKIVYGKGELYLGTLPDLAANSQISEKDRDNFQLLSNLLLSIGKPIWINEYVHGYQDDKNLMQFYFSQTPVGQILVQLIFAFVVLLWWSFTPWRPRREIKVSEDTAPIPMQAFVQSLGGMFYKSNAAPLLVRPYLQAIDNDLRKRYHVSLQDETSVKTVLETLEAESDPTLRQQRVSDTLALLTRARILGESLQDKPLKIPRKRLLQDVRDLAGLSREIAGNRAKQGVNHE